MVETTGLSKRRTHFLKVRTVSSQCPSADANTGMIVGEAGIILQTTNGGEQWNGQPTVTFNYLYGVSFTDANTGTAVGYENPDGMILRTTDGGNTWLRQSSGLSDPLME